MWEPEVCNSISKTMVRLFFAYCDSLAYRMMGGKTLEAWHGPLKERREKAIESITASTETDVTDTAGLITEGYALVTDTETDEDLEFWLLETHAKVCRRIETDGR